MLTLGMLAAVAAAVPAANEDQPVASIFESRALSAFEMLALAEQAARRGDTALARKVLHALERDPDVRVRSEARFRLGRMLASEGRLAEAALLFRAVLDEQPDAQPVRLELARLLERLGDEPGARRALREAQAGGLPPAVARLVDRWSAALRARKAMGSSFEIALAPDSNINRATRSSTLGTVIGDFTLDPAARQRSGTGLSIRGQAYRRVRLSSSVNLLARAETSANLYRQSQYNDIGFRLSAGPEISFGSQRLNAAFSASWRRFGGRLYARTAGFDLDYSRPVDRSSQVRVAAAVSSIDNRFNQLEDGRSLSLRASYERALSGRAGVSISLAAERRALRDAGYSSKAGQVSLTAYREFGPVTLIGSVGYGRLRADERLFLYPERRRDASLHASVGSEFRQLAFGGFAPLVRFSIEHVQSSIELYQTRRIRTEIGLARAF